MACTGFYQGVREAQLKIWLRLIHKSMRLYNRQQTGVFLVSKSAPPPPPNMSIHPLENQTSVLELKNCELRNFFTFRGVYPPHLILPGGGKQPRFASLWFYWNKDDNIHKSEAMKRYGRQTLSLVECKNWIYKNFNI